MQLDGSNRKRVYQADASSEFGALLCDDQNFYTIERTIETQGDTDYNVRCVIDGKIIVDEQQKKADGTIQSVTYTIDCDTGLVEPWPLYYDSVAAVRPIQVEILAAQSDTFLIRCGINTIDVQYDEYGAYTMLNSQYATITKTDFWNGSENYTYFS